LPSSGTGSIRGGIIVNKISDTTAELGTFSVHPKYQSKGYGKRLLSFAESYARDEVNFTTEPRNLFC
jgi:GNAT superfamily N-acetyltransferase